MRGWSSAVTAYEKTTSGAPRAHCVTSAWHRRARAQASIAGRCVHAATRAAAADSAAARAASVRPRARRPTTRRTTGRPLRVTPRIWIAPAGIRVGTPWRARAQRALRSLRRAAGAGATRPKRRELGEQLVPDTARLPFGRRKPPLPRPSRGLDPRSPRFCPGARRARSAGHLRSPTRSSGANARSCGPIAATTPASESSRRPSRSHSLQCRTRRSQSSVSPATWGERIRAAARAIGSGAFASAMTSSAAATRGTSSSAVPSERL